MPDRPWGVLIGEILVGKGKENGSWHDRDVWRHLSYQPVRVRSLVIGEGGKRGRQHMGAETGTYCESQPGDGSRNRSMEQLAVSFGRAEESV